jgi:putative nucleotidyltransferase with HDIG domain
VQQALARSDLVLDFARKPLNLTAEYTLESETGSVAMLGMVSPVVESGWGVVVHRPVAAAFESARRMVISALLATVLLLLLAVLFAIYASRWLGQPIRQLSETAHSMASGNFAERLPEQRIVAELADLSADFNLMAGYVEDHVAKLNEAARQNRELFISSIRAFAAAIDAKDPYTRGHSERVAELSRQIAKSLGQNEEFQHKLWIGALLHDVGKIGIEDRVLNKSGVLTPEEFEQMKAHPAIGAEILQSIEPLREMLPAVRWHHENWNGKGYPDQPPGRGDSADGPHRGGRRLLRRHHHQSAVPEGLRGPLRRRADHPARRLALRRQGGDRLPAGLRRGLARGRDERQDPPGARCRAADRGLHLNRFGLSRPGDRPCHSSTSSPTCWPRTTVPSACSSSTIPARRSTSPARTTALTRCASSAPTSGSICARARPSSLQHQSGQGEVPARREGGPAPLFDAASRRLLSGPGAAPAGARRRRRRTMEEACEQLQRALFVQG